MGITTRSLSSSRGVDLIVDLESGCGGRRDTMAAVVSDLQDAQKLLDSLWGGDSGCAASRNRPAGSLGLVRSHSVTIPDSDAAAFAGGGGREDGGMGSLIPTTEGNKADGSGAVEKQRRQRSPKNPPKPPRPPRAPSLDAADLKLVKEMSELAMLRRARMERLRAIRKMKVAAASTSSSSSGSSFLALVVTLFFCIVIVWQGFYSRNGTTAASSFEGSPVSSFGANGGLISVQYFKNNRSDSYISSSASPKIVEQASGWDKS